MQRHAGRPDCLRVRYTHWAQRMKPVIHRKTGVVFGAISRLALLFGLMLYANVGVASPHADDTLDLNAPLFAQGPTGMAAVSAAVGDGANEFLVNAARNHQLAIAAWPHLPHHYVVALFEPAEGTADAHQPVMLTVAVLRIKGPSIKVVAYGEEHFDDGNATSVIALDLAAYRIKKNETAFGVRVTESKLGAAYSEEVTLLHLFRIVGIDIAPVFHRLVEQRRHVPGQAAQKMLEATVTMAKPKPRGFSDIELSISEHPDTSTPADTAGNRQGVEHERYRWNGFEYTQARLTKGVQKKVPKKKRAPKRKKRNSSR